MDKVTRPMARTVYDQIEETYHRMADEARYRPAAPSDGMGHITVPEAELDIDQEALRYAQRWWAEESELKYWIGCAHFPNRPAIIYAVEAARNLCAGDIDGDGAAGKTALKLLKMAVADLESQGYR